MRHILCLYLLLFGAIVSDMAFSSARALEFERLVDVDASPAFDGLTGFAFVIFLTFFFLFSFLWVWDLRLEKQLSRRTGPMAVRA